MQQLFGMVDWFSGPDLQNSAAFALSLPAEVARVDIAIIYKEEKKK